MPKKKKEEIKEKKIDGRKRIDPKDITTEYSPIKTASAGRPKNPPSAKKILKEIIPINDIFNERELYIYNSLVDTYIKDFDEEELSYGDIDDIMTLAMNKVFEVRLLSSSKDSSNKLLDISKSVDALRKQSDNIKENLATRRKDRVNPNEFKGFSIVDLAVAYDNDKRMKLEEKVRSMKGEQEIAKKVLSDYPGNKYDIEGNIKKNEDI